MRILMLNYEFPPLGGGAANANYYILKEFTKNNNIHIDLVTSSPTKYYKEKFSKNINIYRLNINKKHYHFWNMIEIIKWSFKAYHLSKKLLKKNKYDLCHCWFGWPSGIIGYLFRRKAPYIISLRGSDVPGYNPRLKTIDFVLLKPLSRIAWRNAITVIANSDGLRRLATKTLKRKIDLIYNGININEFNPKQNKTIAKKIKLISTGRLIERKGYQYLIRSLKGLQDKFELILVGDGNIKQELKKMTKKLHIDIRFKGRQKHSDIAAELKQSDIFVLPSLNEGMSNSVLEAMASGLPVIVTDVGGTKELVKDNGIIVKKRSAGNIRKALLHFYNHPDKISEFGKNSRKIAETMSWKASANKYLEAYNKCVEL